MFKLLISLEFRQSTLKNDSGRVSFIVQGKMKRATVGPLPGVTQDIAGFKVKSFLLLI